MFVKDGKLYALEEVKDYYRKISFVCYNERDFKSWLSTQTIFDTLGTSRFLFDVAENLSNDMYKDNLQATKELIELFYTIQHLPHIKFNSKYYPLNSPDDYVYLYDSSFYTYKNWSDLVESEKEQSEGLTEEECKELLNGEYKEIWKLPCGWYVQHV